MWVEREKVCFTSFLVMSLRKILETFKLGFFIPLSTDSTSKRSFVLSPSGRIKVGRWNERAQWKGVTQWTGIKFWTTDQRDGKRRLVGNVKRKSGKWVMSLKGFVNRFSHDCHIDIDRDVSTAHCRSSSVFQLFNNPKKLGRTKNLIAF